MSLLIGFLLCFCCHQPTTLSFPIIQSCAVDVSSLPNQAGGFQRTHRHIGGYGTRMNLALTYRNLHSSQTAEHVTPILAIVLNVDIHAASFLPPASPLPNFRDFYEN